MNLPASRVTELCETCWEQLATAPSRRSRQFAEELLRLMGWEVPLPFSPREQAEALSAHPYLLRGAEKVAFVAYFVPPGTIEPPSVVVDRGLDFCPATRMLAEEAHSLNIGYALITDLYRSYLYDTQRGELLLHADSPRGFDRDFVPVLSRKAVDGGALDHARHSPRGALARQLRTWQDRWTRNIARHACIAEETAALALDRLVAVRYLFERDILRRTRWRLQQRFQALLDDAAQPRAHGIGQQLVHLFHDMWFDWRIDLFEGTPELDAAIANDELAVPMLREFSLICDAKFEFNVILESFNFGDPSEKLRIRMVPDRNDERDTYLAKQSLRSVDQARIEIDLNEEGYRALFHWFDRVVNLYERLDDEFRSEAYPTTELSDGLDLFAWSSLDAERPRACADHLAHACARGFGLHYATPRQYRTARLLLTLHIIQRLHDTGQAVNALPSLRPVLMKRPEVLTPARIMRPQIPGRLPHHTPQ